MIAVGTVLGAAVTPEIAAAWSNAVNFLGKVLYEAEEVKYKAAEARSGGWRGWKDFTISAIDTPATAIKTFTFVPADGNLPADGFEFTAGQYLTVRVDENTPRHYTCTSKPGEKFLQITTKRIEGGAVSSAMHDNYKVGDVIRLSAPFGPFNVTADTKSAILISAGIGMTPMKVFLDTHGAVVTKAIHVDKDQASVPFYDHFVANNAGKNTFLYSKDGRPDMKAEMSALVKELAATTSDGVVHKYYVCGPTSFMQSTVHALVGAGVPKEQIVWEAFAPQLSCPV